MCGWLFSFCFLHETVFGNGQIAITHNYRLTETKPKQNAHSFNKIRFEVPIQKGYLLQNDAMQKSSEHSNWKISEMCIKWW